MPDQDESTRPTSRTEPETEPGRARYERPLLRWHGAVGTLTAKSGDNDFQKTITDIIDVSDVHAKENIVPVVWE